MVLLQGPEEAGNFWHSLRRVVLCGVGLKSSQLEWLAVEVPRLRNALVCGNGSLWLAGWVIDGIAVGVEGFPANC